MANVATIANAINAIAAKVNVHQILIEDLKTNGAAPPAPSPASLSEAPPAVDYDHVQRMIDSGLASLKDDLASRASRDKAMLETSINHSVDQKVATAVGEVDQKACIALLEERFKRIELRIEELAAAPTPLAPVPDPESAAPASAAPESAAPASADPASADPVPEPAPASAASKSRASRRRGKASSDESPPGTLTLE